MDIYLRFIGITDRRYCGDSVIESVRKAGEGGIKTIQLREKNISDRDFYEEAISITRLGKEMGMKIFINDRYDIAEASEADGVHIGANDLPLPIVRRYFTGLIGKTVKSKEEALKAEAEGADYVAIGPFYHSHTKPSKKILPMDIIPSIRKDITIPLVVIGGINSQNAESLLTIGAYGIAVSKSLFKGDIIKNAKKLTTVINKYGGY